MIAADLLTLAETALPVLTLIAVAGSGVTGYLLASERVRRQRRIIRRQDRTIAALEGQLSEAEDVVARVTGGTDDIIAAVRGTHHRQEEGDG
ncbi:hypothetical protein AB0I72_00640 [Nocardiopsis sp. NPDC049922]|uniref:hypothetical protein n=1 Tax=Nocardiopsis sp. NPDC049922 TaxID=3155157 RepID=UPI0033E7C4BB